jgi:cell division protein FtsW
MALSGSWPAARVERRAPAAWDHWLLGATLVLITLGLVMVYSASIAIAQHATGHSVHFLARHAVAVAAGLAIMTLVMHSPIRLWQHLGPFLLIAGIALLVLVLVPGVGVQANGSARWLSLGMFRFQPSEFMKLAMVVYVAGYLVRRQGELRTFLQGILMIGLVLAVIGALMLLEPDLGAVVVLSLAVFVMLFLGGIHLGHFLLVLGAGIGGMIGLTLISPYRMARVTAFLDPWADPFNTGFQLTQALIAFGRGEWLGVGLGGSVQKLAYLPAAHTDFMLAVLAEELGFVGVAAVLALFAVLVWRAFVIARRAERLGQLYAAHLARGLGVLLGLQAIINAGVNMGVLPTKGLTLPFMSYGGSSLVMCCAAIGLLLRVERETRSRGVPAT